MHAVEFFETELAKSGVTKSAGLLFRGEGGSGKTWLFERLCEDIGHRVDRYTAEMGPSSTAQGYILCSLRLDREEQEASNWFIDIRDNIKRNVGYKYLDHGMAFARSDCLRRLYDQFLENFDDPHPKLQFFKPRAKITDGISDTVFDQIIHAAKVAVGTTVEVSGGSLLKGVASTVGNAVVDMVERARVRDEIVGYQTWTRDDFERRFPTFLARDLNDIAKRFPDFKLVVLIDSHDRMLSTRDLEKARSLEGRLKTFVEELDNGLVCIFSQYDIPWFHSNTDKARDGSGNPGSSHDSDGNDPFLQELIDAGIINDQDVSLLEPFTTQVRATKEFRLLPFDREMTERLLDARGFSKDDNKPFRNAIAETTSLPFEIDEKAQYLRQALDTKRLDHSQLVSKLRLPFGQFFTESMEAKPQNEAELLSVLWRLDWFTLEMLVQIARVFGNNDRPRHLAERVLHHSMIERRADGRYRIDLHFTAHLQAYYLRSRIDQRFSRRKEGDPIQTIVRLLNENREQPSLFIMLLRAYYDEAAGNEFADDAGKIASAVLGDQATPVSELRTAANTAEQTLLCHRLLEESLVGGIQPSKGTMQPAQILGSWPLDRLSLLLDRVADLFGHSSGLRSKEALLGMLDDTQALAERVVFSLDLASPLFMPFCRLGAKALQARGLLLTRFPGAEAAASAKITFNKWVNRLRDLATPHDFNPGSRVNELNYWLALILCDYYSAQPHVRTARSAKANQARAFVLGESKRHFLRSLQNLETLVANGLDPEITESIDHRRTILRLRLHQLTIDNPYGNRGRGYLAELERQYEEAKSLYDLDSSDFRALCKIMRHRLETENGWESLKEVQNYFSKAKELYSRFGGDIDILFIIEKTGINIARYILTQSLVIPEVSASNDGQAKPREVLKVLKGHAARGTPMVHGAHAAMDIVHSILRSELGSPKTSSPELTKLFVKHLRKTYDEGFVAPDEGVLLSNLDAILERVRDNTDGTQIGIAVELARVAYRDGGFSEQLAQSIEKAFSAQSIQPLESHVAFDLRKARWAKLIADPQHVVINSSISESAKTSTLRALSYAIEAEKHPEQDIEEIRKIKYAMLRNLISVRKAELLSGIDSWSELSAVLEHRASLTFGQRQQIDKAIIDLLHEIDPLRPLSPTFLAEFEASTLQSSPLDLTRFATVAKLRNRNDESLTDQELISRSEAVNEILALSPKGVGRDNGAKSAEPNTTERMRDARLAATSARIYCRLANPDSEAEENKLTRVLLEAIIAADPELPNHDPLRHSLRLSYAEMINRQLHRKYDQNRNHKTAFVPANPNVLEGFAVGSHETFVFDLVSLIGAMPAPRPLVARDFIVTPLTRVTLTNVENGASALPGPVSFEKADGVTIALQSNLLSAKRYRQLRSEIAPNPAIFELGGPELPIRTAAPDETVAHSPPDQPLLDVASALKGQSREIVRARPLLLAVRQVSRDLIHTTERGPEYVEAVLDLIYPGLLHSNNARIRFAMGGSNSSFALFIPAEAKGRLLKHGWFNHAFSDLAGLNRMAILACSESDGPTAVEAELRELASVFFADLKLVEYTGTSVCYIASEEVRAHRVKIETFRSIFKKLFPRLELVISSEDWWRSAGDDGGGHGPAIDMLDDEDTIVDETMDYDKPHILQVVRPHFDRSAKQIRQVSLINGEGETIRMDGAIASKLHCYFVEGLELECYLKRGRRGNPEVAEAKLKLPPAENYVDAVVLQRNARSVALELIKAADEIKGKVDVNLGLMSFAGYPNPSAGQVVRCAVKETAGGNRVVHILPRRGGGRAQADLDAIVGRYFHKTNSMELFEITDSGEKRFMRCSLQMDVLRNAGYSRLWAGDRLKIQVITEGQQKWIRRILECDRPLVRGLEAVLDQRGGKLRAIVGETTRLGLDGSPLGIPIKLDEDSDIRVDTLPNSARLFVDLQKDLDKRWCQAASIRLDVVEDGKWIEGTLAFGSTTPDGRPPLTFFRSTSGMRQALVIPALLAKTPAARQGLWIDAKICRSRQRDQELLSVYALRRPATPYSAKVSGTVGRFNKADGVFEVEIEGAKAPALLSISTLLRADLPSEGIVGMPIVCWTRVHNRRTWVIDLWFDSTHGWSKRLCYLLPNSPRDKANFVLADYASQERIKVPKWEPFLEKFRSAMPGTFFKVNGFAHAGGNGRLVSVEEAVRDTPWHYGVVARVSKVGVVILGAEDRKYVLSWQQLRQRQATSLKSRMLVRYTLVPEPIGGCPIGLIEGQSEAGPWEVFGYVTGVDPRRTAASLRLVDLKTVSVQIDLNSLDPEGQFNLVKGLPMWVRPGRDALIRTNNNGFISRAAAIRRADISALSWEPAIVSKVHPTGGAFCEMADDAGVSITAYIAPELASVVAEDLKEGDRLLCQSLPGFFGRRTAVNLVPLGTVEIDSNYKIAVCEDVKPGWRQARFTVIGSGRSVQADASAFFDGDGEEIFIRRGDIFYVNVDFESERPSIVAILERVGRRFESPQLSTSDDPSNSLSGDKERAGPSNHLSTLVEEAKGSA